MNAEFIRVLVFWCSQLLILACIRVAFREFLCLELKFSAYRFLTTKQVKGQQIQMEFGSGSELHAFQLLFAWKIFALGVEVFWADLNCPECECLS